MTYLYYPGCSLTGTSREYDIATRAALAALGVELTELADWICCGASAAEATSQLLSLALPAVNLAIARRTHPGRDLLVPCSACYLNLKNAAEKIPKDDALKERISAVLAEEDLRLDGPVRVRHLLDVLVRDIGPAAVADRVVRPLAGMTIAPYYGCQCLRPYVEFDDPEAPRSMDGLIAATGATVHEWDMGGRCCGAAHMNTKMDVGLTLVEAILRQAEGATAVVTVCPMCQMNLEAYQKAVSARSGRNLRVTILYLPQLLGLAMGLTEAELGIDKNLAVTSAFRTALPPAPEPPRDMAAAAG